MSEPVDDISRAVGASLVHGLGENFGEVSLVERIDFLNSRNPSTVTCFIQDGCVICVAMTYAGSASTTIDLCDHNWVSQVMEFILKAFKSIGVAPDPSKVWVVIE